MFKPEPQLSPNSAEVPGWIYAPYEACQEEMELCATGEAVNFSEADGEARKNLASIFEVKVTSELNSQIASQTTFPWQGAVTEEVHKNLTESVDEVLETVQIKKHYKHQGLSYALASLNRIQAGDLLYQRLTTLDQELELLWKRKSRTNLRKMVRLYLEREKINERYTIIRGQGKPSPVAYGELLAWKNSRIKEELLTLRIGQAPEWMSEKLKELLTESGFKLVKGNSSKALSLNVDSIKEFLNVEGFEKYTFTVYLTSFEDGEKKKVLTVSETVTGRTQADALLKVKSFFNDYLAEHLSDLHLD